MSQGLLPIIQAVSSKIAILISLLLLKAEPEAKAAQAAMQELQVLPQ
jgi:hypothetical protein